MARPLDRQPESSSDISQLCPVLVSLDELPRAEKRLPVPDSPNTFRPLPEETGTRGVALVPSETKPMTQSLLEKDGERGVCRVDRLMSPGVRQA